MSLRLQQYNSLRLTERFLKDLLHHSTRPKTVKELKERAGRCLRHYPFLKESGEPIFSNDNFKE